MKNMMMKMMIGLCAALALMGCGDDSAAAGADAGKAAFVLGMGIGSGSFYGTVALAQGSEDGADFYEHDAQSVPFSYGRWVFIAEVVDGSDNITRYTLDENNVMGNPVQLDFPGGSQPANMFFVSKTKAFVSLSGAGKLAVINPEAMKQTGSIDISKYAAGGDGNPDPTSGMLRDGLLFVNLSQKSSLYSAWDTAACVLVVDATADTVVKMITDGRASALGGLDDGTRAVVMDERGDIYVYSNAVWGYQAGLDDGFLRIKKGETKFDPDYYFSVAKAKVEGVAGNAATYGLAFAYAGGGVAYSMLQIPALTSNPPDYVNDHNYQPVKIDLYNKTIAALPVPPSTGWASMGVVLEEDGNLLLGMSTAAGNGIYRYHPATSVFDSALVLKTTGAPTMFFGLED